ncbi:MAG: hypothetical protein ACRD5G_10520 [Candidatus Acidiferrales bacterium]
MRSETITHLALIAQLRWLLFRNALRTPRAQLEFAARALVTALGALIVIGGALGLFALSFYVTRQDRWPVLLGLIWGLFLAWQIVPVLITASTASLDFGELLRFPVRFSTFLLLSLAYSLLDPGALAAFFWLAGIAAGIGAARPDALPLIVPAFLGLAAVSLLLNRIMLTWLERLLKHRRGREIFFVCFIVLIFGVQLIGISIGNRLEGTWKYLEAQPQVGLLLPPGLAYAAVESSLHQNASGALVAGGVLWLYAAALFIFYRRRLLAQYRGEDASTGSAPQAAAPVATRAGWNLPLLPGPAAALVEREVRYTVRNGFMLMNLVVPLFIPVVLGVVARTGEKIPEIFAQDAGATYFACVAYALMVLMHVPSNHFAFEGRGIQFLILAPVHFREVVAAKNLVYAALMLLEVALVWLVLAAFGRAPGALSTVVTLAALPFLVLAQLTTGNLLSLQFPRRFDFGRFKQRQSGMSVLLGLLQQIVAVGIAGAIFALARWTGHLWVAGLVYLVLGAAMWQAYGIALEHYDQLAARRREALLEELCHQSP